MTKQTPHPTLPVHRKNITPQSLNPNPSAIVEEPAQPVSGGVSAVACRFLSFHHILRVLITRLWPPHTGGSRAAAHAWLPLGPGASASAAGPSAGTAGSAAAAVSTPSFVQGGWGGGRRHMGCANSTEVRQEQQRQQQQPAAAADDAGEQRHHQTTRPKAQTPAVHGSHTTADTKPPPPPAPMGRKYFTVQDEAMFSRMVPPGGDSAGSADVDAALKVMLPVTDANDDHADGGIEAVTGKLFAQLLLAGFFNLLAHKERLNKENEFPIPDNDTGNNMVTCFRKAVRQLVLSTAAQPGRSLADATRDFGDDVVMNGQGNSGTILSHYFKTLADEVATTSSHMAGTDIEIKPSLSPAEFAVCLEATGQSMQYAVSNMVEGTMVSTARDGSSGLQQQINKSSTVRSLLDAWNANTKQACLSTHSVLTSPKTGNKVLEGLLGLDGAPRVDSGASGFLMIIEGMHQAYTGALSAAQIQAGVRQLRSGSGIVDVRDETELQPLSDEVHGTGDVDDDSEHPFQFCTEAAIRLSEGTKEADVKAVFAQLERDGQCDSVACVCTQTLAKLHLHTNEPGAVFRLAKERFSCNGDILLKEKVDDMFAEREQARRGPAWDMRNAHVHVMFEGSLMPREDCVSCNGTHVVPIWWMAGDLAPMIYGDSSVNMIDVANSGRQFFAAHGETRLTRTATPSPQAYELLLRRALEKLEGTRCCRRILCLTPPREHSTVYRNLALAAGFEQELAAGSPGQGASTGQAESGRPSRFSSGLPQEARDRIVLYDTGYLGYGHSMMAREALRCTQAGMSDMGEILERLKYVEGRCFNVSVMSEASYRGWAKWGRIYKSATERLRAEDVPSGVVAITGCRPGLKQGFGTFPVGGERLPMLKMLNLAALLGTAPVGAVSTDDDYDVAVATALDAAMDAELLAIKNLLKPGQVLMDVMVATPIREDKMVALGRKVKATLPVRGDVSIVVAFSSQVQFQYGDMALFYWIQDDNT
eukprot:COSAG01_NODE_618_length_14800_cov_11.772396_7_plen_987_part_00